ncbi:MAG: DsrE family protein [Nitrospirota bacterium]|nr:DsrE family protein [Nitrospirota bacterium]
MKKSLIVIIMSMVLAVSPLFINAVSVSAEEYAALQGLKSVKAVFDVRAGSFNSAAAQLGMIHKIYKDSSVRKVTGNPEFVLVFIGPSVRLVSTATEGLSAEEKATAAKLAGTIKEMAKDGIKLEICMAAVEAFGVAPASLLPEIKHVQNGWISLIGYQAKDYSLVPIY